MRLRPPSAVVHSIEGVVIEIAFLRAYGGVPDEASRLGAGLILLTGVLIAAAIGFGWEYLIQNLVARFVLWLKRLGVPIPGPWSTDRHLSEAIAFPLGALAVAVVLYLTLL